MHNLTLHFFRLLDYRYIFVLQHTGASLMCMRRTYLEYTHARIKILPEVHPDESSVVPHQLRKQHLGLDVEETCPQAQHD